MQLQHPGLSREQIIARIKANTGEHARREKIEGKLGHKTAFALAFERAAENES